MATWNEFAEAAPEIAALGLKQFEKFHIAYLATVRKDGSPRVHPVSPIFADGRLFVATAPTYWENVGQPDTRPVRQRWREH